MGLFSKAFKSKPEGGSTPKSKKKDAHSNGAVPAPPRKKVWEDAWTRKEVEPEEVQELLRGCTHELKSRALDLPFLLLPFRPASDPSAARTFIRNYFNPERTPALVGEQLEHELVLTEPMVLSSVLKWCWSRLAGGVVTWEAYELFCVGEQDSDMARDAFATFLPLSVASDARTKIIFDFFDLMAAIAAHGKTNGMGGRKLSRLAGWWAFDQMETGNGFDGGYKAWSKAADATSHLFFAYLRSLSPDSIRGINGVATIPLTLQNLVRETKYPPDYAPYEPISKVVMVVDSVSPTPFSLLRRARHFEFREDDRVLSKFSDFEDPVEALTDECKRVLKSISSANQSEATTNKESTSLGDSSWSRFEDIGFNSLGNVSEGDEDENAPSKKPTAAQSIRSVPQSTTNDLGRPTTPSWADFMSSGFTDEASSTTTKPLFLPPDKVLPPIELDLKRGKSSQSHFRPTDDSNLVPGELASINALNLDDAFWWVWITSLAGEETLGRKAVFGRCALIETTIRGGAWLVIEEMVKGAAPEPEMGAYIAEKKSRFTFGKRSKTVRTKSLNRSTPAPAGVDHVPHNKTFSPASKTSIGPDQHAKIQAAAAALQQKQKQQDNDESVNTSPRRARQGDAVSTKTNSVFTLQPVIMSEAGPAMKWANTYDKKAVRSAYLGDNFAGTGSRSNLNSPNPTTKVDKRDYGFPNQDGFRPDGRDLPALPTETPGEDLRAPSQPPPAVPEPTQKPPPPPKGEATEDGAALEETPTITQADANNLSPQSSPESKSKGNKLKKQPGTGGLRGIFGTKKKGLNTPTAQGAPDSSAVAAARAAYSGPKRTVGGGTNSLTRRLSGIGKKKGAAGASDTNQAEKEPLPLPPAPFNDGKYDSQTSLSRVDSREQKQADHEFQTFDNQGPLEQPAFVPGDPHLRAPEPESEAEASRPSTTTSEQHGGPHFDPPIGRGQYEPSISTEEGDTPEQESGRPYSPEKNRWSQIRKNAAERAGRMSEEQNNPKTGPIDHTDDQQTDDGEESGEETIESRVARIKARVAELTGGIQQSEAPKA